LPFDAQTSIHPGSLFGGSSIFYHAFVTYGDGTTENFALDSAAFSAWEFFGITSDQLIASVHLGLENGIATTGGYFGLNNLTIGSDVAIPEPSTLALLGLGLAFVFGRKKAGC
jgi:hypothetical protein